MARNRQEQGQEQGQDERFVLQDGALRIGKDVGLPMAPAGSDVRSLPGMDKGDAKKTATDFLTYKDEDDVVQYKYSGQHYVPTWSDKSDIAGLPGLLEAVTRMYNTLVAMQGATTLALPDGRTIPAHFTITTLNEKNDLIEEQVPTTGDMKIDTASYGDDADLVAYTMLECMVYGLKLLTVQKQMGKSLREQAIREATADGVYVKADGTPKARKRNTI